MASKPPGVLGTFTNPGHGPSRTRVGNGTFHRPSFWGSSPLDELEHKATQLAHAVSKAIGWHETRSAAFALVGQQSFTAGVVYGMGENLVKTVVAFVDFLNTLALAEYWESKHDHSFAARLRSTVFSGLSPASGISMELASHFLPGFDRKAEQAYEERGAMADAIAYAFTHPKEFFKELTKSQEAKATQFAKLIKQQSLSGNFHAGVLMGELLFDLLMAIDLIVGLAKLAMAVPRLARYTQDMVRLAQEVRVARQIERKAAEGAPAGPPLTKAEKEAAANRGQSPSPTPRPDEREWVERDPTKNEKGVYGEAQGDVYMEEDGFQKLNGDIVKVGDDPLGPGIDGVWKNTNPPPDYVISETKYGTSKLTTLDDGTKQMSDDWVEGRLDKAVGPSTARAIRDADENGLVEKWLLHVDENGNVTKSLLDKNGNVIPPLTGGD